MTDVYYRWACRDLCIEHFLLRVQLFHFLSKHRACANTISFSPRTPNLIRDENKQWETRTNISTELSPRWSNTLKLLCVLSNTIVLRRGVVGTVWMIKGSFTPTIYYAIAITIRFRNGLYTHCVIAIIMYPIENSGNCILNRRSKWTPLCYCANVIAILILFYGVNRNRNWMQVLPCRTVVRVLKP